MKVRVLPLRSKGVKLPYSLFRADEIPAEVFEVGHLAYDKSGGSSAVCLNLRPLASGPGVAVFARLYEPKLIGVGHDHYVVRGFEQADGENGPAGYLQEWAVFIR